MTKDDYVQEYAEVSAILRREWGSVLEVLAAFEEADWHRPSRCAGWTVLDLARHTVWGSSMEADALRRARAGDSEVAQGRTLTAGCGPAETLQALRESVAALDSEVGALGPGDGALSCPMPHGATPLPLALDIFVFEAGIHAGDFAAAAGHDRPLTGDVVPVITSVLSLFLPAFTTAAEVRPEPGTSFSLRGESLRLDGAWSTTGLHMGDAGAEPTLTVSGTDSDVLLFALGRLDPGSPRLVVEGSAELARDFKTYVPGP